MSQCDRKPLTPAELGNRLFITRKEAAQLLDLDPRTVSRSIEAGECTHVRVSGSVRIPVAAFLKWAGINLENGEAGVTTPRLRNTVRPLSDRYRNDDPPAA